MTERLPPDASGLRIAVAVAEFNQAVTDGLLEGALTRLEECGCREVTVVRVPGAFELPLMSRTLAAAGHDAVVALGAVIKGETDHYEYIAAATSDGLMRAGLDAGLPVAMGVLTARDSSHALERSRPGPRNKGAEAAEAAVRAALALKALDA